MMEFFRNSDSWSFPGILICRSRIEPRNLKFLTSVSPTYDFDADGLWLRLWETLPGMNKLSGNTSFLHSSSFLIIRVKDVN